MPHLKARSRERRGVLPLSRLARGWLTKGDMGPGGLTKDDVGPGWLTKHDVGPGDDTVLSQTSGKDAGERPHVFGSGSDAVLTGNSRRASTSSSTFLVKLQAGALQTLGATLEVADTLWFGAMRSCAAALACGRRVFEPSASEGLQSSCTTVVGSGEGSKDAMRVCRSTLSSST